MSANKQEIDVSDMSQHVVEKIQQKTVVAQVMEKIRQLIANGEYRVHEKIPTEAELARQEGRDYQSASELLKRIAAQREEAKSKTKNKRARR